MSEELVASGAGGSKVDRQRSVLLIAILTIVAFASSGIAILMLYGTALAQTEARLTEVVQSQARLMEAVARFNARHDAGHLPGDAIADTLREIEDAHERFKGFGQTGEFTLARREGDQIVFVLSHRHYDLGHPAPVPISSDLAEPMRRALAGKSGTVIGLDYRGTVVCAAYEPVDILGLGMVAKIDLSEVRAPFLKAGLWAGGAALLLTLLGAALFRRITAPLIRNLEERVTERTRDLANANRELKTQVTERIQAEQRLLVYQGKLRSLASELSVTEERERRQIALDLHDHVGQSLAVIQMKIDALRPPVSTAGQAASVAEISRLLDRTAEGLRSLTFELSPPVLHELGLTAGLEWLAEQFEKRHGLRIEVVDDGAEKPLDTEVRALIFRAVRELLMNVVKHARAQTATVSLWREGESLCAEVGDDGTGFDVSPESAPKDAARGFGIFSIRERMDSIGGSVEIHSARGQGTRALLVAPLRGGAGEAPV